ncbi:hypothetical protein [Enorma phocaeensis]|uniref:hypothetical protein n=1 Tax=Enorma phocaeensis TaxID=1871019 RepID=UPI000C8590F6|nr:hypothetical protein [Enorma phocaeensis]
MPHKVFERLRRPVALILTILLVAASIPLLPVASVPEAFAAPAEVELTENLSVELDTHVAEGAEPLVDGELVLANLSEQAYDLPAIETQVQAAVEGLTQEQGAVTLAVDQAIAALAAEDAESIYTLVEGSIEVVPTEAVSGVGISFADEASAADYAEIAFSDDAATITAKKVTTAPLAVEVSGTGFSYTVNYSYTKKSATDPSAAPDTVEATLADQAYAGTITATVNLSVTDYWADQVANLTAETATTDPLMFSSTATAAVAGVNDLTPYLDGAPFSGYTNPDGTFSLAYESGTFTATGLKVGAGGEVTVEWYYPDGTSTGKTTKVTVGEVKPFSLDGLTIAEQPFRLQADQEAAVLAEVNQAIKTAIESQGEQAPEADYYSAVTFASYDGQGAVAQTLTPMFTRNDAAAADYASFTVTDPTSVTVAAMKQLAWGDTGLTLSSENGSGAVSLTAGNAATTWVKAVPTVAWEGHGLAYGAQQVPASHNAFTSTTLSAGDGIHSLSLYAIDDTTNEIVLVTGVGYQLDTLAPVLTGAEATAERAQSFGGYLFGDQQIAVEFTLRDELNGNQADTDDTITALQSGVDANSVAATYDDNESGETDIEASLTRNDPLYSFTIAGDRDVDTADITVTARDNAGNELTTTADQSRDVPIEYTKLVAESSGPSLSIGWDTTDAQNGSYYRTNRTLTVTVNDPFFNYTQQFANDQVVFTVSQNGSQTLAIHPSDFTETAPNSNVWTYTLPFTTDADWEVSSFAVSDIVGHTATAAGESFTIDKTAPVMQVSFDNNDVANGRYYSRARTATITVTEHNFSADHMRISTTAEPGNGSEVGQPQVGAWSSDGDTHIARVTFPGQGVYTLSVEGEDLANNAVTPYASPEFVVDTLVPEIELGGVANQTAYAGDAVPTASVHDTNLDPATTIVVDKVGHAVLGAASGNPYAASTPEATATDMTVTYTNPASVRGNDGVYTITVTARDLAGSTATEAMTWSVNRFGSTYVISDETGAVLGSYITSDELIDVVVTEINPSGLQEAATAVELTHDAENTTLERDADYTVAHSTATGWHEYTYTVGQATFDADGVYRVLFHSLDNAQNISENTMEGKNAEEAGATAEVNFAVDDTAPIASFVDLESNGRYEEAEYTAQVMFEDNLMLDHAQIVVNGETYAELDAEALAESSTYDVVLAGSAERQEVSVVVFDAAGNESDELVAQNVLVSDDPIVLWMSNLPLFAGSIVAALVAVAGIGFAVYRKKQQADE